MISNKNEFDLLTFLENNLDQAKQTQRKIAKSTDLSVGLVNKTITALQKKELIDEKYKMTSMGLEALEPYRVKKALIIAAGFGSRMMPITLNTPKPLVRVKNVRIIDTILDALVGVGIENITIVRGYRGEQFDQLLYKYPNISFIENPFYNEANNISSIMCARHELENSYILEADLVLHNSALITKYQYATNYLGVPTKRTDDWCFKTKGNIITDFTLGGYDSHHMFGISYWNEKDGQKLKRHVKKVYEMPGGKERFWDQVALEEYIDQYEIVVRPCTFQDIVEIDSYKDLQEIDSNYT